MEKDSSSQTIAIVSSNRVLYTPSTFAKASLLYLQEVGFLKALEKHTSSREGLSSYLFFVILSGSGVLHYDGKDYHLVSGDMVFIDCKKPYSHTTSNELWSLRWCHFNGPTFSFIYKKYCERGGKPVFRPHNAEPFMSILDKLYSLASSTDYIRDMKINQQLSELCTLIMAESWHPEEAIKAPKKMSATKVKEYLEEHYKEHISLDDLATKFYINKYYLTRVFKEQYGQSISAYLTSFRITHAKYLLRFTDKTVEDIGIECGLGSLNYFSRVFKDIEGVSPSAYRSQW